MRGTRAKQIRRVAKKLGGEDRPNVVYHTIIHRNPTTRKVSEQVVLMEGCLRYIYHQFKRMYYAAIGH